MRQLVIFSRCAVRLGWIAALALGFLAAGFAQAAEPAPPHDLDLRFETTTFLLNLEKQGLEDNTFTNGLGRDTTLIGNLLNVSLHKRLLASLDLDLGVFANMPFGHETEVSQVRPIFRLQYRPDEHVAALIGTLHVPHRGFHDAVFDDANRFVRPLEQGAQVLVETPYYHQDAFANWQQAFGGSAPNRYDVGYAGQLRFGPLAFNAQVHWVRNGQALLKLDRSFSTANNVVTAAGPELVLTPSAYFPALRWWDQIGVRFTYLTSYNEPMSGSPVTRGRGYETKVWLDVAGWRPSISFWRSRQFLSLQGDPEFAASNFPELGLSKLFVLGESASIEIGVQARRIRAFFTEDGVTFQNRDTFKWVNQQYIVFNCNWDTARSRLLGDLLDLPPPAPPGGDALDTPRRFSAKLDALTYVYNIDYAGLASVNGMPVSNRTFAGQYLAPVLRYTPFQRLNLDAGIFVGLPVGATQPFHTVQPILAAEYEFLPDISLVAGTIKRNHPFADAVFDDATLFSRPIEQGFQVLVNRPHYQQDLFISWNQIETFQKAEQFDVGYAGRAVYGNVALNGQVYWAHSGGAQFSEARTFFGVGIPRDRPASNNFVAAVGPELLLEPGRYWSSLAWLKEIDVMALYLTSQSEPTSIAQPIVRGRGYLLSAGLNIDGWRPYINFWRGEDFVSDRGDPIYAAAHFTEFGLLRDFQLPAGFSLRVGGFGRLVSDRLTHTEYALLNWSWDDAPWRSFCLRPTLLHRQATQCTQY